MDEISVEDQVSGGIVILNHKDQTRNITRTMRAQQQRG